MARTLLSNLQKRQERNTARKRRCGDKISKKSRPIEKRVNRVDVKENAVESSVGGPDRSTGKRKHGASHQGDTLNRWREDNMRRALLEFNEKKNSLDRLPVRQLARVWSVPYTTFRRRIMKHAGEQSHRHSSGRRTILHVREEEELAEHISSLASVGFPCNRKEVRSLAFEYTKKKNIQGFSLRKNCAGYYWFSGFLSRHQGLVVKKAENLSIARAMSMNKTQISDWFTKYKNICTELGIADTPSHLWDVHETGCQNIHKADAVVAVVGKPTYNITALEKGETSTALVCINAVGSSPPPMIIHKGKLIGKQWKNGAKHGVVVRASENGYINKDLFTEFGRSFVEYLRSSGMTDGLPHLLIMDSHYSHLYNLEFLQLMKDNEVHVFALPPHCSHWLQPLDRGVFRSFKQGWQNAMKEHTKNTAGRKLEKKDFFLVFNKAWDYGITVENAQGGFRGSGLFPINMDAIPRHAFDPSATSERDLAQENSECDPSSLATLNTGDSGSESQNMPNASTTSHETVNNSMDVGHTTDSGLQVSL